jgi:tetratricopeptide (TPR) repeat protein
MRSLCLVLLLLPLTGLPAVRVGVVTSPKEQYQTISDLVTQADQLVAAGDAVTARSIYETAQGALQQLRLEFPTWDTNTVNLRLDYVTTKLAALKAQPPKPPPVTGPSTPGPTTPTNTLPAAEVPGGPAPADGVRTNRPLSADFQPPWPDSPFEGDITNQFRQVLQRLRVAESDRALLAAKLREALSAQPAATDPRELARAEERIRVLQKENAQLRGVLEQAKASPPGESAELEKVKRALAEANRKLQLQGDAAAILIAEANLKLDEQTKRLAALSADRDTLQRKLELVAADKDAVARLTSENAALRQQLTNVWTQQATATDQSGDLARQMQKVAKDLAESRSALALLQLENEVLAAKLAENAKRPVAVQPPPPPAPDPRSLRRIQELEQERTVLRRELAAANRELTDRRSKGTAVQVQELNDRLVTLRSKLGVYEAKAVPYTREELALFKKPKPILIAAAAKPVLKRQPKAVAPPARPPSALVAEGNQQFAAGQLDKAEQTFKRAAAQEEKDVWALCNLATTQVEQNRLAEAEQTLQKALAIDPNDPSTLSVLAYVRYNQAKYDEALDAASRAVKSKPEDPALQCLLGSTLVQKGLRLQAETAFRKALQVNPGFADAHRNLAAVYLNQQPPMVALARWHYQRGLAAGVPLNPDFERKLDTLAVPGTAAAR